MTVHVAGPGEPGYAVTRANSIVQERPAGVVTARSTDDVREAVRHAVSAGLPVAVQATGHAYTTAADGALLISTREMTEVTVDPAARTARIAAGVRAGDLISAAAAHGLAPINGASPTVGMVGFTLGGGLGPLGRSYGYSADNVRSLEIVTADGAVRTASPSAEPELFWGVRGSRGNLGVVTSMEVDLVPVTRLYGGGLFFDAASTAAVLEVYREWVSTVPDAMSSSVALLRLPPFDEIPEPIRGKSVLHVRIAYTGDPDSGADLVAPLRNAAPALIDAVHEMPYTEVGTIHNDPPDPAPFVERSALLASLEPETLKVILELAGPEVDAPLTLFELRHLGGALGRAPEHPSAVGFRSAAFSVFVGTLGLPELVEPAHELHARIVDALTPWRVGGPYLSFLSGTDLAPEAVASAYEPADYSRLRALKTAVDPENVFRVNHNIPPSS